MIVLESVTKTYRSGERRVDAVRGANFALAAGEFASLSGKSGSGKSTILHLVAGLDRPTSGRVIFEGRDLSTLSDDDLADHRLKRIGLVFQFFNLLPDLSAIENVALPRLLGGERLSAVRREAAALLERVGLGGRMDHRPDELSGGEMQRVALARALATRPAVLLADEPTGNLDSATGSTVLALIRDLHAESRMTVLIVTHDPGIASSASRRLVIEDGVVTDVGAGEQPAPVLHGPARPGTA